MSAAREIGHQEDGEGSVRRCAVPIALLAALAFALMLPLLIGPMPLNDSHAINLIWSDQFSAGMRRGDLWPRWLPASYDGLGAPVFYFYGPVAFWVAGLFGLAGVPLWPAIVLTGIVALLASGIGAWAVLRSERAPRALAGAAFFLAAPYHLLDMLRRGALAEFLAIALLPWFALTLRRAASGAPVRLAIVYAMLIATHLPTALLTSVFLLPMLVWDAGAMTPKALLRIGAGLLLGVAIAAAYWLPALLLQPFANMGAMQETFLMQPAHWRPQSYWSGGNPALLLLLAIIVTIAIPAIALRSRWAMFALAALVLAVGLAWPLWLLPPLDRVQFPWRIVSLAEFGVALAIGRSRIDGARLLAMLAPALLATALVLAPSILTIDAPQPEAAIAGLLRHHPEVAEYRPHGAPAASIAPGWSERTANGVTTVRRYAFPIWSARCADGDRSTSASPEGLLQYRGTGCTIERVTTLPERIGNALSAFALLITLALLLRARRAQPRAVAETRILPA